jgi:hypothetical protein
MNLTTGATSMLRTAVILDMLKEKLGSDYKTAQAFGIPPNRISTIRTRGIVLNDDFGLKAAKMLDFPEEAILLSLAAERSLNSPSFNELARLADKYLPPETPHHKRHAS